MALTGKIKFTPDVYENVYFRSIFKVISRRGMQADRSWTHSQVFYFSPIISSKFPTELRGS
jgi:hypothetical protein